MSEAKPEIIECTKDHPWDKKEEPHQQVRHHNVHEVGEQEDGWPGGDWVTYECKNCGYRWREELPQ